MTSTLDPATAEAIRQRFLAVDASNVADVLDTLGLPDQGLAPSFAPFPAQAGKLADWAFTIRGELKPYPAGGGDPDKMAAYARLTPGTVSVWSGDGAGVCFFGELIAIGMKERGCVGALVDGGIRDVAWVGKQQFPVYARHRTPVQSIGRWKVTGCDSPVPMPGATVAHVTVAPGDFILADEDGAICIPRAVVETVLEQVEALGVREVLIREELAAGLSLSAALAKFGGGLTRSDRFRLLDRLTVGRDLVAEGRLALKMAFAGALAWRLGVLAGEPRPIFAALVPFVAMSGDPFSAVSVSLGRILGVFAGVGIGVALLHTGLGLYAQISLGLLAGAVAGIPLRVGGRPNVQAAVSALFLIGLGRLDVARVGVTRIWETAIGAGVAIVVAALLWPPDPARELRLRLSRLRQALATDLTAVADDLATGSGAAATALADLRANSLDAVRMTFDLESAARALRLNPLRRRDAPAVASLDRRVRIAARLYRHARSVARDVADADRALHGTAAGLELAAATRDIAEATDLAVRGSDEQPVADRAWERLDRLDLPSGDGFVIAAQLRQMLADLSGRVRSG